MQFSLSVITFLSSEGLLQIIMVHFSFSKHLVFSSFHLIVLGLTFKFLETFKILFYYVLFYIYECFDYMYLCVWCLKRPEKDMESSGFRVTDGCE